MRATTFYCLIFLFLLHILSLDGVYSTRQFPPNHVNNQDTIQDSQPLQKTHTTKPNESKINKRIGAEVKFKEMKKIGSKPPRCEDKCYGCEPCEAIQVPTTSSRVGVQYTNYEPEGWKCKCGPTLYAP